MNDTLNVDSPEELSTAEEVGTDDAASQETTVDSTKAEPTGREKALRDTEAALKEKQAEFTRMSQQLAELKGSMETMLRIQQQAAQPVKQEEKDWIEELEPDKVIEDPLAAMKQLTANLRKEFATVLQDRDSYWRGEIERVKGSSLDPELKSAIEGLKANPELADLPEAKLVAIAKQMGTGTKAVKEPRGNIAARSAAAAPGRKSGLTPEQEAWLIVSGAKKTNKRDDTLE
jgi:hypothetical protein